ncbi:hypothetical protein Acsp06_44420 [Actinomycetospora sp. NBRC 106375]|uniref:MmpS family transport accessory protein n=1 Tax=Actinomycetospora sp. NBRC 106375 TaxID=3032207 RepID=UPI0024A5B316|nr:MmpS family transport accessory protein [Actinomycetospora sp. NBRC 106375]GLZ48257.1 hypothetical protein Acsp06_44420 [Actinomycetospora sp. NBRC 106375]
MDDRPGVRPARRMNPAVPGAPPPEVPGDRGRRAAPETVGERAGTVPGVPPVPRDIPLVTRAESPLQEPPAVGSRRRVPLFVVGAVAAVALGLLLGAVVARAPWATGTEGTAPPPVAPAVAPAGVRYEVTGGAARALVTYGHDGDVTRGNGAQLPWSEVAPLDGDGTGTYALTVQAVSDAGERITCRITVDGLVVAERTSSGRSSAVACFGEAGRSDGPRR